MIVINSLFEFLEGHNFQEIPFLMKKKNEIIHNFHKIDPVKELCDVTKICEMELKKYSKLTIQERNSKKRSVEKKETVEESPTKKPKIQQSEGQNLSLEKSSASPQKKK